MILNSAYADCTAEFSEVIADERVCKAVEPRSVAWLNPNPHGSSFAFLSYDEVDWSLGAGNYLNRPPVQWELCRIKDGKMEPCSLQVDTFFDALRYLNLLQVGVRVEVEKRFIPMSLITHVQMLCTFMGVALGTRFRIEHGEGNRFTDLNESRAVGIERVFRWLIEGVIGGKLSYDPNALNTHHWGNLFRAVLMSDNRRNDAAALAQQSIASTVERTFAVNEPFTYWVSPSNSVATDIVAPIHFSPVCQSEMELVWPSVELHMKPYKPVKRRRMIE